jgi:hypothetical protein
MEFTKEESEKVFKIYQPFNLQDICLKVLQKLLHKLKRFANIAQDYRTNNINFKDIIYFWNLPNNYFIVFTNKKELSIISSDDAPYRRISIVLLFYRRYKYDIGVDKYCCSELLYEYMLDRINEMLSDEKTLTEYNADYYLNRIFRVTTLTGLEVELNYGELQNSRFYFPEKEFKYYYFHI